MTPSQPDRKDVVQRSPSAALADHYHEIMGYRSEAARRYHANETSVIFGPPAKIVLPTVSMGSALPKPSMRLGPFGVRSRPPLWFAAEALIRSMGRSIDVLEIGPGAGILAGYLKERFPSLIRHYYGLDRDRDVRGPYERIETLDVLRGQPIDVVIASEVAEHMTADQWYGDFVAPLGEMLAADGGLCLSVPNPVTPGGIARDFTHVQAYPWYDLYAILRLSFDRVDVTRTFYAWSPQRIAFLLPRLLLCPLIELDWCDGLLCVARSPRR